MHRKFDGDAAGIADSGAHALRQFKMVTIARAQIRAGLSDADDRAAGRQFGPGQSIIEIALEIERGHSRIVGIVEPQLRTQPTLRLVLFGHSPHSEKIDAAIPALQAARGVISSLEIYRVGVMRTVRAKKTVR